MSFVKPCENCEGTGEVSIDKGDMLEPGYICQECGGEGGIIVPSPKVILNCPACGVELVQGDNDMTCPNPRCTQDSDPSLQDE